MTGRSPKVSVVLPTYNRLRVLPRAVDSVLSQSFRDLELLLVDDASADGTAEWAQALALRDPRVRLLRHPQNRGGAAARNTALAAARGELVAFQDSDDEWAPGKLAAQVAALDAHPEAGACYAACVREGDGRATVIPETPRQGDLSGEILLRNPIPMMTAVVRRSVAERAGPFDEALPRLQDWEYWIRVAQLAPFLYVDQVLGRCELQADSLSRDFRVYERALSHVLERHAALFRRHPRARFANLVKLGAALALHVDGTEARRVLRRAVRSRPLSARAWAWMGLSLIGPRRLQRLRDWRRRSLSGP
jgi:glycosyltransferase involved in cell wall biosynthesis